MFIDKCKKITNLDSLPLEIKLEEFKKRVTKWKEKTSTSPISKRHLGHLKALFARPPSNLESEDRDIFQQIQTTIVQAYLDLINYALHHEHPYKRWNDTVNLMIFKQPGNNKVHKMRCIHLHENDLTVINGMPDAIGLHSRERW